MPWICFLNLPLSVALVLFSLIFSHQRCCQLAMKALHCMHHLLCASGFPVLFTCALMWESWDPWQRGLVSSHTAPLMRNFFYSLACRHHHVKITLRKTWDFEVKCVSKCGATPCLAHWCCLQTDQHSDDANLPCVFDLKVRHQIKVTISDTTTL